MDKQPVVLVVEDDGVAQLRAEMLLKKFAQVVIVASVNAAIRSLRGRNDITHVILDGYVPQFDGDANLRTTHDLARLITGLYPDIKVYTASGDEKMNKELAALGCTCSSKEDAPLQLIADTKSM